ncbi:uncharacterized protein YukE [Nocardia transvalensis]|uniref:Uncharacterized protein YukE n=1 Tax=Nocardia transvalensis TaxID=37333 RepID=A0A7W9PEQ2_9NOCA|nr:type VII secretion target [Nocardia transvalensis]MBB5914675.1 uncharacterized protein YukE [Nocardia transvalensis]
MTENVVVDTVALQRLAQSLRNSATEVSTRAKDVHNNQFEAAKAGAAYAAQGAKIHDGLEKVGSWLDHWVQATNATADAFGSASVTYSNTDKENATTLDTGKK